MLGLGLGLGFRVAEEAPNDAEPVLPQRLDARAYGAVVHHDADGGQELLELGRVELPRMVHVELHEDVTPEGHLIVADALRQGKRSEESETSRSFLIRTARVVRPPLAT